MLVVCGSGRLLHRHCQESQVADQLGVGVVDYLDWLIKAVTVARDPEQLNIERVICRHDKILLGVGEDSYEAKVLSFGLELRVETVN